MSSRRSGDPLDSRSRFRTKRLLKDGDEWYFLTREGSVQGPFHSQSDAHEQLERYIRMANYDMLSEGEGLSLAE